MENSYSYIIRQCWYRISELEITHSRHKGMSYRQEETAKTTFLFILLVFKIELKWLMKELLHESSDLGGGHHGEGWGDGRHLYASPSRTFRPRTTAGSLQFTPTSTEFPSERENMIILLFFDMIFDHIYLKLQK